MKLGAFVMPSHPPERELMAGYRWDLEQLVLPGRLGFHEASARPAASERCWS